LAAREMLSKAKAKLEIPLHLPSLGGGSPEQTHRRTDGYRAGCTPKCLAEILAIGQQSTEPHIARSKDTVPELDFSGQSPTRIFAPGRQPTGMAFAWRLRSCNRILKHRLLPGATWNQADHQSTQTCCEDLWQTQLQPTGKNPWPN
jgi:hypothetical protein